MVYIVLILLAFLLLISPVFRCAVTHPFAVIYYGIRDGYLYIRRKRWNEASYGQMLCYIAESSVSFGCGKTLSATDGIVSLYRQYDGKQVWCPDRKKFVTQRIHVMSNVDFLTIPFERLVSLAQFVQWSKRCWALDVQNDTLTVTYVLIDEASSQLNSRSFKSNFSAPVIEKLLTVRHFHATIILTAQRASMVDALLRSCCQQYIGCNKTWRFQSLNYYDANEIENAQSPALVQPLRRTCWFIRDKSFANYDTHACVESLLKSCEEGDMLSDEQILALRVGAPPNMDAVVKPSKRWQRTQRKRHK